MRILQVMAGAEHGGAEEFFYRLVPALSKAGIQQQVVMRPHEKALARFEKENIPVATAPFNRAFDIQTPKVLRRSIKNFSPDIVMTWMSRASHMCPKGDFTSVARLGGYYDLKYYKKADYLVGNTKDIQEYFLKKGWPENKTAYLPNFVDEPTAAPPQQRKIFNTPEGVPLILSLGRLHDDKAFDVLIRALAQIPDAFLWIGGKGPREPYLKTLAKEKKVNNRIHFLGWQEDVSSLYKACDIYCCPSRIEPLGNVVIEGWAHRKPVVAAQSDGPKGLISCGNNGLLAPLEDVQKLADQINHLIQDNAFKDQIAQKGRQTYEDFFTETKVVDQYRAFFDTLLSSKLPEKKDIPCAE